MNIYSTVTSRIKEILHAQMNMVIQRMKYEILLRQMKNKSSKLLFNLHFFSKEIPIQDFTL